MGSTVKSSQAYIISSDIGIVNVTLKTVTGYDVDDIVHDKAVSYARAVQLAAIGKNVDMSKPTAARTLPTIWLNNEVNLGD